jgi:hypothetical protein
MSESNSQIPRLRHPLYKGGINSHLILSYGTYFMIINGIIVRPGQSDKGQCSLDRVIS